MNENEIAEKLIKKLEDYFDLLEKIRKEKNQNYWSGIDILKDEINLLLPKLNDCLIDKNRKLKRLLVNMMKAETLYHLYKTKNNLKNMFIHQNVLRRYLKQIKSE